MLGESSNLRIRSSLVAEDTLETHGTSVSLESPEDKSIGHSIDVTSSLGVGEGLVSDILLKAVEISDGASTGRSSLARVVNMLLLSVQKGVKHTAFPSSAKTGSLMPAGLFRFKELATEVRIFSCECSCGTSRFTRLLIWRESSGRAVDRAAKARNSRI